MKVRFVKYASVLAILGCAALSQDVAAQQQKKGKWDTPAGAKADEKMSRESSTASKTGKDSAKDDDKPKIYRFKSEKKGASGGTQMMMLLVEDIFTGKAETFYVPNNDPASKEYDPLSDVAAAIKDLAPGSAVEIETEKVKGRTLVKSVSKANAQPGEETPNGYVFVDQKEVTNGGVSTTVVTLSKFGREVQVAVPMLKSTKKGSEGKREPDPKVDYQIQRLKGGTVVEAVIKPGKMPMIAEIYEYRPPERGKYIGPKEIDMGEAKGAGFEIAGEDGSPITFTLEGTEQTKNNKTVFIPNPMQVAMVRKLKKDTPIEVRYRIDGTTWVLRNIRLLGPNETLSTGQKESADDPTAMKEKDSGKMSDDPESPAGKGDETMEKDKDSKDKPSKTERTNP